MSDVLIVPLVSARERLGVLFVGSKRTDLTGTDEVAFVRALGARKSAREILGPEAEPDGEAYARALAGEVVVYDGSAREAGGTRHFQTSLSPLRDAKGKVTGLVGVRRETTGRRKLQAQLMASDRLASVGMLAAGVAHEINNPLAAVVGNLELASLAAEALYKRVGPVAGIGDLMDEIREGAPTPIDPGPSGVPGLTRRPSAGGPPRQSGIQRPRGGPPVPPGRTRPS